MRIIKITSGGARGPAGPQGEPGIDGANGIDGEQGEQGPQGIQGLQGDQGNNGADSPVSVAQCLNTDTTTNLNLVDVNVPLGGSEGPIFDSDFTLNTLGIECNFSGRIHWVYSIYVFSAVERSSITTRLTIDGVPTGRVVDSSYNRGDGAHNNSSNGNSGYLDVVRGNVVGVVSSRGAVEGTVLMHAGLSGIEIRRLT